LSSFDGSVGVDLLAHARQESTRDTGSAGFTGGLGGVVDLESDLVKLRDGISTDFTG
jgi:hypothetical protein